MLRDVDTSAASGVLGGRRVAWGGGGAAGAAAAGLMSVGEAVATGYPLSVTLSVPLWLVNATQLSVRCGVMVAEAPQQPPAGAAAAGEDPSAGRGDSISSFSALAAAAQVRQQQQARGYSSAGDCMTTRANRRMDPAAYDTLLHADYSSSPRSSCLARSLCPSQAPDPNLLRIIDTEAFRVTPRPSAPVNVYPRSLELLSYPPGVTVPAAAAGGDDGGGPGVAVVFSIGGSRWTQLIALPRPGEQPQPKRGAG